MATRRKTVKKTTPAKTNTKLDFSDSLNAIKGTAKTINIQVKEVATEVVDDIKDNSEQLREITVAPVKKAYNKVSETISMDNIAKATKSVNDYTLKTAEGLLDGALENGEKWQGIASKAVKGGLKLAEKQQDMMFDTLEAVKGQLIQSTSRFRKLFSNN